MSFSELIDLLPSLSLTSEKNKPLNSFSETLRLLYSTNAMIDGILYDNFGNYNQEINFNIKQMNELIILMIQELNTKQYSTSDLQLILVINQKQMKLSTQFLGLYNLLEIRKSLIEMLIKLVKENDSIQSSQSEAYTFFDSSRNDLWWIISNNNNDDEVFNY